MADRLTCCPHCNTSFRITDQQLQTANGAVRCGSCLRVFNALEHLLAIRSDDSNNSQQGPDSHSTPPSDYNDGISLVIENPETEAFQLLESDEEGVKDSSVEEPDKEADALNRERIESLSELDRELDDLLISDDMDHIEDSQTVTLGSLSEPFQPRGLHGDNKGTLFDHRYKPNQNDKSLHSADESWAVELLNQLEAENTESTPEPEDNSGEKKEFSELTNDISFVGQFYSDLESSSSHPGNASYIRLPATPDDTAQPDGNSEGLTPATDDLDKPEVNTPQSAEPVQPGKEKLFHAIPDAPVEMEWRQQPAWRGRLLWSMLSLLASLLLVTQYAWFNINQLGLEQPWRQGYLHLCPLLGCETPALVAPEKIKASNLLVRSHPKIEQALIIDSVLLNTARFSQPFPDFHLTFSDIKGRLIAQRRFTPQEYLKGELAGLDTMPSEQPVHISLEISDPGKEAVNYTASIPLD